MSKDEQRENGEFDGYSRTRSALADVIRFWTPVFSK